MMCAPCQTLYQTRLHDVHTVPDPVSDTVTDVRTVPNPVSDMVTDECTVPDPVSDMVTGVRTVPNPVSEGLNPPLYAERDPEDQLHQAGTPPSPPPPYTHIHNRIDWGQTSGEYSDQPPPSYSQCVKQDGSHSLYYCNG